MTGDAGKRDPDHHRIANILTRREATAVCPSCTRTSWKTLGELGNMMVALGAIDTEERWLSGGGITKGVSCYLLICENCGFVRLHAAEVIDRDEEQP